MPDDGRSVHLFSQDDVHVSDAARRIVRLYKVTYQRGTEKLTFVRSGRDAVQGAGSGVCRAGADAGQRPPSEGRLAAGRPDRRIAFGCCIMPQVEFMNEHEYTLTEWLAVAVRTRIWRSL